MSKLRNWSFKDLVKFLKVYGFKEGHVKGSHYFYNGKINGIERVVQAIYNKNEKKRQSDKTMRIAIEHSGIPKEYFEEWKKTRKVHKEIMY